MPLVISGITASRCIDKYLDAESGGCLLDWSPLQTTQIRTRPRRLTVGRRDQSRLIPTDPRCPQLAVTVVELHRGLLLASARGLHPRLSVEQCR